MPADSPHLLALNSLDKAGLILGCRIDAFCPTQGLTRAQAATVTVRAFGLQPLPGGSRFVDVAETSVHAPAINALAKAGLLHGYSDRTFRPTAPMTRGQLATLLARSAGFPRPTPARDPFVDVPRGSIHAPSIAALRAAGIRVPCSGDLERFCPDAVARRDATASFVHGIWQLARPH